MKVDVQVTTRAKLYPQTMSVHKVQVEMNEGTFREILRVLQELYGPEIEIVGFRLGEEIKVL